MTFTSAASRAADPGQAVDEILASVSPGACELAVLFITAQHRASAITIADRLREALSPGAWVGCTCEGVIGPNDEIEGTHGVSLLAARHTTAKFRPFHITPGDLAALLADDTTLRSRLAIEDDTRALVLLGDPFTTRIDEVLQAINRIAPSLPAFGGMASGAARAWDNALLMNEELHTDGLVGFSVSGEVEVEGVVSQGCRPIGSKMLVTAAEGLMVQRLAGLPALAAIQKQVDSLSDEDEALIDNGLLLGVAISEYRDEFRRGDFLIRNMMGVDPATGALAVGEVLRPGQTVQLHVRDSRTADEDLRELLAARGESRPAGALIFSCNGRGTRMFDSPGHDIRTLQEYLPGIPAAGFFAMGEIGPVGGKNHLHGHTASIALFKERS